VAEDARKPREKGAYLGGVLHTDGSRFRCVFARHRAGLNSRALHRDFAALSALHARGKVALIWRFGARKDTM